MQMHTKAIVPFCAMFSMGFVTFAQASFEPGSFISEGGTEYTPTLETGVSSDNNFFRTPNNEDSRLIWTIAPNLDFSIVDGPDLYEFGVGTVSSLHNKESIDNHTQVNLSTDIHKEFTSQHRVDISGYADWIYEGRGTGLTEGLGDTTNELVKYQQQNVMGTYEYGSLSSKAQVALSAGFYSKKYQNFRAVSQYRDFNKTMMAITGYYNTQSASRTFIELKGENYRYDTLQVNGISRDSDDLKLLLGMEWDASALISGSFKFGYQSKDFSSSIRENFSGLSWLAELSWQPLSYSQVQFTTSSAAKDPLVLGDYIEETAYGISWNHSWSDFLSSVASVNYIDEQYKGNTSREDKTKSARLGLNYIATDFGMVSTYVDVIDQNSTQNNLVFDSLVFGVNFTFALKAN